MMNKFYETIKRIDPNNPCVEQLGPPLLEVKQGFEKGITEFLYLVRSSEYIRSKEFIYKIGETRKSPEIRIRRYGKGTEIFDLREVRRSATAEKRLIDAIKDKTYGFEKVDRGKEWFRNLRRMRPFFSETCNEFLPIFDPDQLNYLEEIPQRFSAECTVEEEPEIKSEETSDEDDSDFETPEASSEDSFETKFSSETESFSDTDSIYYD